MRFKKSFIAFILAFFIIGIFHMDSFALQDSVNEDKFVLEAVNASLTYSVCNSLVYGNNMKNLKESIDILIENHHPKSIIFPISFSMAARNDFSYIFNNIIVDEDGDSHLQSKDLFLNLKNSKSKGIFSFRNNSISSDNLKDIEPIGDLDKYLSKYPDFKNSDSSKVKLDDMDEFFRSLEYVIFTCEKNNVDLEIIMYPLYYENFNHYDLDDINEFYNRLSNLTDFWDFSFSSISMDPRFFYNSDNFRDVVGDMIMCRIEGRNCFYVPNDFGHFVNKGSKFNFGKDSFNSEAKLGDISVPVLIYHGFSEDVNDNMLVLSGKNFEKQVAFLKDHGFNTILPGDLIDYVYRGKDLPKNPVMITIDDGYENNYDIAFPILKKYNQKATIFVIGSSVGKSMYKDSNKVISPHFSVDQGREMIDSGLVSIQSHTMDMHQSKGFESDLESVRESVSKLPNESKDDYMAAFNADLLLSKKLIENEFGEPLVSFAYPRGINSILSEYVLKNNGVLITFTTNYGPNIIVKGLPQSLLKLNRYFVTDSTSESELLSMLKFRG